MNALARPAVLCLLALAVPTAAQHASDPLTATGRDPALTLYNGGYAVVRETLDLELAAGEQHVTVTGATSSLEADSVMLRDPTGARTLAVLEQGYRNDPVSQERLLALYEGETIRFLVDGPDGPRHVSGRIVRSGYGRPTYAPGRVYTPATSPVIEVDGELRFQLPGLPLFPALADDTVLEPTLSWVLATDVAGPVSAELAYISGGFGWDADYNAVSDDGADTLDLTGWVTMSNASGKTFREATVKLMAGDVAKLRRQVSSARASSAGMYIAPSDARQMTERTFDEFHLYTVMRPVTLRDAESKQVEMVRAAGVPVTRHYVYDGAAPSGRPGEDTWWAQDRRTVQDFGAEGHRKVWVFREFRNEEESGLGVPLPAGRIRFYTRDTDGRLEFTGEADIDHTPRDETIRAYTGNAFDVVGDRVRTDFTTDRRSWAEERFVITLRNHRDDAVTVAVREHMYRWTQWEVLESSHPYRKDDSRSITFDVDVAADGETVVEYLVRYTW